MFNGKIVKQSHLTPKPKSIIERIILASTNPGDIVVDFFVCMCVCFGNFLDSAA